MSETTATPIDKAIEHFGSQAAMGQAVGVTQGMVSFWKRGLNAVSWQQAIKIEEESGGVVTRHDLRPDIFGPSQSAA